MQTIRLCRASYKIKSTTDKGGSFEIYDDDNTSFRYEKGKGSTISLAYNEQLKTLTIGARQGSFSGMLTERTLRFVWVKEKPVGLGHDT